MNANLTALRGKALLLVAAVLLAAPAGTAVPAPAYAASRPAAARCHEQGRHPVRVPYVEGMRPWQARKALRRACLRARVIPQAQGIVAYQVPRAGVRVERGSVVRLHLAATG